MFVECMLSNVTSFCQISRVLNISYSVFYRLITSGLNGVAQVSETSEKLGKRECFVRQLSGSYKARILVKQLTYVRDILWRNGLTTVPWFL